MLEEQPTKKSSKNIVAGGRGAHELIASCFRSIGAPSIPSSFSIPRLYKVFSEDGALVDDAYNKRVSKFLAEFEWYIEALRTKEQKALLTSSYTV